jgi:hypothetical protein
MKYRFKKKNLALLDDLYRRVCAKYLLKFSISKYSSVIVVRADNASMPPRCATRNDCLGDVSILLSSFVFCYLLSTCLLQVLFLSKM